MFLRFVSVLFVLFFATGVYADHFQPYGWHSAGEMSIDRSATGWQVGQLVNYVRHTDGKMDIRRTNVGERPDAMVTRVLFHNPNNPSSHDEIWVAEVGQINLYPTDTLEPVDGLTALYYDPVGRVITHTYASGRPWCGFVLMSQYILPLSSDPAVGHVYVVSKGTQSTSRVMPQDAAAGDSVYVVNPKDSGRDVRLYLDPNITTSQYFDVGIGQSYLLVKLDRKGWRSATLTSGIVRNFVNFSVRWIREQLPHDVSFVKGDRLAVTNNLRLSRSGVVWATVDSPAVKKSNNAKEINMPDNRGHVGFYFEVNSKSDGSGSVLRVAYGMIGDNDVMLPLTTSSSPSIGRIHASCHTDTDGRQKILLSALPGDTGDMGYDAYVIVYDLVAVTVPEE